jgi:hypothetical protein
MESNRLGVERFPPAWGAILARLPDLLRRVPFSIGLVLAIFAVGALAGTMFRPIGVAPAERKPADERRGAH